MMRAVARSARMIFFPRLLNAVSSNSTGMSLLKIRKAKKANIANMTSVIIAFSFASYAVMTNE